MTFAEGVTPKSNIIWLSMDLREKCTGIVNYLVNHSMIKAK